MHARDFTECRLLEGFAGPADRVLPRQARRGLTVRVTPGWWEHGNCLSSDGEAWFPDTLRKPNPLVQRICTSCPVRKSCLAAAILGDEYGIWGGTRRGQRLHARARMLTGDPHGEVMADLLASPMPATEYHIPDPQHPVEPTPLPVAADVDEQPDGWREAS
jgi:WhiB family transcriptional regulator, redox-sensing transcriptional regulator